MFLISSLTSAHVLSPGPSDARQKCTVSLGNRTVTMNATSSLSCITCSSQSSMRSTRCSSPPRKCVHEEIILVNSRMKTPFHVLSTNQMPPRKWTFYKENHRRKGSWRTWSPLCTSPAPRWIGAQRMPQGKRGLSTQSWRTGAPVLALPLTPSGIWAPSCPCSLSAPSASMSLNQVRDELQN